MNDLIDHVQNSHVYLYADNLKPLCVDCFEGLQYDINGIYEWSRKHQLEFHPEKCKAMNFKCSQSPLFLGEAEILFTREIMDLGMLVTDDLCWQHMLRRNLRNVIKFLNFFEKKHTVSSFYSPQENVVPNDDFICATLLLPSLVCYNWYFESVRKVSAQSVALGY